jgi:hypothetical protein
VSVPSGPYRSLSRLPAEVWLDAAGLARRISVNSEPAAATGAQVWSIVELWDFGVAVDITPPGPGEVLAPREAYRLAKRKRTGGTPDPACVRRPPARYLRDLHVMERVVVQVPVRHGHAEHRAEYDLGLADRVRRASELYGAGDGNRTRMTSLEG